MRTLFRSDEGEYARVLPERVPVEETPHPDLEEEILATVSMQIQDQLDRLLLMDSLDFVLYGMQLRQFLDIVPIP